MSPRNRQPRLAAKLVLLMIAALLLGGVLPALSASLASQPPPPEMEAISDAAILPRLVLVADPNPAPEPRIVLAPQELDGVERVQTANFQVQYLGGWPTAAHDAFEYALDLWGDWISSPVTIHINASWEPLRTGVLGGAGPVNIYSNFPHKPLMDTWYFSALANKLSGTDLSPGVAEIDASFNSSFPSWYFGLSVPPGVGQYDFVSVVLHEIAHGLGFAGSMGFGQEDGCASGTGCWGYSGDPVIYDRFTENAAGQPLLSFPSNTPQLGFQLTSTSNNIFFDSPRALAANGGRVQLVNLINGQWQGGSSYSHLGENFNPTPNRLMTYSLSAGDVIHDPGPVARAMLNDMGWAVDDPTPTPTHTPTVTRTPTPRYTPMPTNTPSVWRHLPVIEYRFDRPYSISGSVRYNGSPISGITLNLQKETADHVESLVASTTTDSSGSYRFNNPPALATGESYFVRFQNNRSILQENFLWRWETPRTWSGVRGPVTYAPFDIADITLLSPQDGVALNFPATFTWQPRQEVTSDNYEFDIYDEDPWTNPLFYSQPLGYVGEYILNSLPVDNYNDHPLPFVPGDPYVWEVWVYSPDGGYGVSLRYRQITFGPARQAVTLSAIDIQRLVEQSRRQRMDLRR